MGQRPGVHAVAMLDIPRDGRILGEGEGLWHHCACAACACKVLWSLRVAVVYHAQVLKGHLHSTNTSLSSSEARVE